jgi:multisubunit Na+/H+ antiporter MnhB subunit
VIGLLEIIFQVSGVMLLICAIYYYLHFKKIKRERKLTPVEITVYVVTHIAFLLLGSSYLLLLLDKNY